MVTTNLVSRVPEQEHWVLQWAIRHQVIHLDRRTMGFSPGHSHVRKHYESVSRTNEPFIVQTMTYTDQECSYPDTTLSKSGLVKF